MERFKMDHSIHMVIEEPKSLNEGVLIMWRKIAESGRMGRRPEGPPAGEIASKRLGLSIPEIGLH